MERANGTQAVHRSVTVAVPVDRAFHVFSHELGDWWIKEYTWSGPEALGRIGIEPRDGGLCYEIGPYGFRLDWGRVLAFEPPHRLAFTWQISVARVPEPDPGRGSEVEVRFAPDGSGTRVELEHRHLDRHGPGFAGYRDGLATGWAELLGRYAQRAGAADRTGATH